MPPETRTGDTVDGDWLMEALSASGYEVWWSDREPGVVKTAHPNRPNVALKIHPELRLISVHHYWRLKKSGLGKRATQLQYMNAANFESLIGRYCIDSDGALGVHSHLTLTDRVSAEDIDAFLSNESDDFVRVINSCAMIDGIDEPWSS